MSTNSSSAAEYPPALKVWLVKSLGGIVSPALLKQAQQELMGVVKQIKDAGLVDKVDWAAQPAHKFRDADATLRRIRASVEKKEEVVKATAVVVAPAPAAPPPVQPQQQVHHHHHYYPSPPPQQQQQQLVGAYPPATYAGAYLYPPPPPPQQQQQQQQYGMYAAHFYPPPQQQQQQLYAYPSPSGSYIAPATNTHTTTNNYYNNHNTYPPPSSSSSTVGAPPSAESKKRARQEEEAVASSSDDEDDDEDDKSAAASSREECARVLAEYMRSKGLSAITQQQLAKFKAAQQSAHPGVFAYLQQRGDKTGFQSLCGPPSAQQLKYGKNGTIQLKPGVKPVVTVGSTNSSAFSLNEDPAVIAARARRFQQLSTPPPLPPSASAEEHCAPGETVLGTCEELEKSYLRTSSEAPHPSTIRPQHVLERAVERIQLKLRSEGQPAYAWAHDQLKAIRQDLKFQHLSNDFAAQVYELHARSAIEYGGGDGLAELNTCLTQLKEMGRPLRSEFAAYQLLYHVYRSTIFKTRASTVALSTVLQQANDDEVKHAYRVFLAVRRGNWVKYFRLLAKCANLGRLVLHKVTLHVRLQAVQTMCLCASKQQQLSRQAVRDALQWEAATEEERDAFEEAHLVLVLDDDMVVDARASLELVRRALAEEQSGGSL